MHAPVSSYMFLIKLFLNVFILEVLHRYYWVNVITFGVIVKNCTGYFLYCDRYGFIGFFPDKVSIVIRLVIR
jgi:hypothetical protein